MSILDQHIRINRTVKYSGPAYSYMPFLFTLICQSFILLHGCLTYSCIPVLHTLIYRSYKLLFADTIYSDMPAMYTFICQAYIFSGIYEYNGLAYKRIMDLHIRVCRIRIWVYIGRYLKVYMTDIYEICQSVMLLYVSPLCSYMPFLYIPICMSVILLYAVPYTLLCQSFILWYVVLKAGANPCHLVWVAR
jgi:hypothetical protein